MKYLLFLCVFAYAECPLIFKSDLFYKCKRQTNYSVCPHILFNRELLLQLRDEYGQCNFIFSKNGGTRVLLESFDPLNNKYFVPSDNSCYIKEDAFNNPEWESVKKDSLDGIAVFSDSYVFVHRRAAHRERFLCFDKNGKHKVEFYDDNGRKIRTIQDFLDSLGIK